MSERASGVYIKVDRDVLLERERRRKGGREKENLKSTDYMKETYQVPNTLEGEKRDISLPLFITPKDCLQSHKKKKL